MTPNTTLPAGRPARRGLLHWAAAVSLAAAALFFAPMAPADDATKPIAAAAITADGNSLNFAAVGYAPSDQLMIQVTWTGAATPVLQGTLDGTNWDSFNTLTSGKIVFGLPLGGIAYRVAISGCTGCSVTGTIAASGRAQVTTW